VVGAGAFGRHHVAKYAALPGVKLTAVADPSVEVRRDVLAKYGVTAVADWRDLLGKVDLVSVCSPATTHATIVRAFLNAGAHVLVEKPIATTLAEADALIALAEKMGKVLTVGHQERFVFARSGLLDAVEAPLKIEAWREGPWTGRSADVSAVLDLMIHDLDLVHRLIPGEVIDIEAKGRTLKGVHADEVSARLTFENGAVAELSTSRIAESRRRGLRAVYADGEIDIDFMTREIRNTTPRAINPLDQGDPLAEAIGAFVAAVREGLTTLVRPEEARHALKTALEIDRTVATAGQRDVKRYAARA
jgi:predicted dehydrogenase